MAREYSKSSGRKVHTVMRKLEHGTLRNGRSHTKVSSRKQAIAIGLSEARREGDHVPRRPAPKKSSETGTGAQRRAGQK